MKKLFQDLSKLIKDNWKAILTIVIILGILSSYSEIKKGINDGWFEYESTCAICPVLDGPSISNLAMQGISGTYGQFNVSENFQTPDGTDKTVWSLFWYYDSTKLIPQFNPSTNEWELLPPVNRAFVINLDSASTSESNMFAMPGIIFDTTSSGIVLAKVYGPLNEAAVPLRKAIPVKSGMTSITAAKEGFPYPVGTPVPISQLSKDLQDKKQ